MANQEHSDKVLKALGKRPRPASEVAARLGYDSHHGVSRSLGKLVKDGKVVKSEKGYAKV